MGHSGHRIRRLPDRPSMIAMRYDMAVVTVSARCWFSMLSPPVDVDQCRPTMVDGLCRWFIQVREVDVNAIVKAEIISRRKALSLMGLAAAFGLAAAPTVLTVSDAEAQTVGMQRRQERRAGRHERRDERRTGRTERREERRTGTAAGTAPAGTTTGSAK
jgi:hypothetical protein